MVGTDSERAEGAAARGLRQRDRRPASPFLVTDFATAELVKVSANAFLATKISFINAMAELCEATGADVTQLADAIGHDERIGRKFLNAGLGFGGGCLPKDIRAFMARAGELGVDQALSFLARSTRSTCAGAATSSTWRGTPAAAASSGTRVGVLGATFKPNSDDVRDSPALNVAGQIQLQGAQVTVYDPRGNDNARALFPTLGYADSAVEACEGADLVLHLTEWQEFREMDPAVLSDVVAAEDDHRRPQRPRPRARWRAAGWTYGSLGRP